MAENLPKLVPWTTFAAKIGPAGLILVAKIGPPLPKSAPLKGNRFWQKVICQNRSPHKVAILFMRVHSCMDVAIARVLYHNYELDLI